MSVGIGDYAAHAHLGRALEQAIGHETIRFGNAGQSSRDREDAVVHAWDDLADTGSHASLVTQVGHVLPGLANDDASLLGRDDGAQSDSYV